jgi:hypothetical protein
MAMSSAAGVRPAEASVESSAPGLNWGPIVGGAVAAAALSVILFTLGSGLGLSAVSPWSHSNPSPAAFGVGAAIFLIVVQWIASGLGGYLTGRLRTKWVGIRTDEVFFRDTAHGFLAWALATLLSVWIVAATATAVVGGGASALTFAGTQAYAYYVDQLLRTAQPSQAGSNQPAQAPANNRGTKDELRRIFARDISGAEFPASDQTYVAQVVSAQTGLSQADAEKRVSDVIVQAKDATDKTRKATSALSFFTFFSLLVGAFIACVSGALGGLHRDEM